MTRDDDGAVATSRYCHKFSTLPGALSASQRCLFLQHLIAADRSA